MSAPFFVSSAGNLEPEAIGRTMRYLTNAMNIDKKRIVGYPLVLRVPLTYLRCRHECLLSRERAQYNPEMPDYISLRRLVHPSDAYFSEQVCGISLDDYDSFLKTR